MTNYEKYKDQLMFILMDRIGVDHKGTPKSCAELGCTKCRFYIKNDRQCNHRVVEWLNAEAKEKKEFTVEEKAWIALNDKISFYARDKSGFLYGYNEKPVKRDDAWVISNGYIISVNASTSLHFSAIKWEDPEPTSREDILNS